MLLQVALFCSLLWLIFHCIYIFFTHCSHDGHLCCFHVLAIVSSAAGNTGMHVSFRITVFSRYMPKSRIAGSYGSSSFLNKVNTVVVPIYIPINSVKGFPFSIPFPAFTVCRLFDGGHFDWCELITSLLSEKCKSKLQ